MHELPWITIFGHECVCVWVDLPVIFTSDEYNDFLVTSGVICQWFSRVTKSRVKIIGKSPHEWPKEIIIHGNECIIPFFTRYISWTHRSATKNHRSLISPLSLATAFSDLTVWRHHSWSVTSREREALVLWRLIVVCSCTRKLAQGDLH